MGQASGSRPRFVGLRVGVVIGLWGGLGGLFGLGVMEAFDAWDARRADVLGQELAEREAAGSLALEALRSVQTEVESFEDRMWKAERQVAVHRATELVLLAVSHTEDSSGRLPPSWRVTEREHLGLVDRNHDRLMGFEALTGSETATLSAAWSTLAAAVTSKRQGNLPMTVSDPQGVWAIGPSMVSGLHYAAYVERGRPTLVSQEALARAERVMGHLVMPHEAQASPPWGFVFLASALFAGMAAFFWGHRRLSMPLNQTIEAARAFVHGLPTARADPERGAREARELARTVNALIERAVRLEGQGRAARDDDIQSAARAIEGLGQGNLRTEVPQLGEVFLPIQQAIEQARRDLLDRVSRLHDEACTVAKAALSVEASCRSMADSGRAQREALSRLRMAQEESTQRIRESGRTLESALDELKTAGTEQRRVVEDVRTTLASVGRRVTDLTAGAERLSGLITSSSTLEQALSGLSACAHADSARRPDATKIAGLVGEGRAALDAIVRELGALKGEMTSAAQVLDMLASSQLDPPSDPLMRVSGPLFAGASSLVESGDILSEALDALVKTTASREDAEHARRGAREAAEHLPALTAALQEIRLGASFEEALLQKLMSAQQELQEKPPESMSGEGQALVADIQAAADGAKERVARLIETTESTLNILRG